MVKEPKIKLESSETIHNSINDLVISIVPEAGVVLTDAHEIVWEVMDLADPNICVDPADGEADNFECLQRYNTSVTLLETP